MKRRDFLSLLTTLSLYPYISFADIKEKNPKTLILVFQRGAVDALSMVGPLSDPYYSSALRPNIFIDPSKRLALNSSFGLHPAMTSFKDLWDKGLLSVFHQVGLPTTSRSHFDCQDYLESGTPDNKKTEDGILARAFASLPGHEKMKLSHLAIQTNQPRSIRGAKEAISFASLDKFEVRGLVSGDISRSGFESYFESALNEVLSGSTDGVAGKDALQTIRRLQDAKKISLSADFPKGKLSPSLKDIAKIIKSGVYVPFIVTEIGGWDTHVRQGNQDGVLANGLRNFSESIGAFVKEIGPKIADVNILTVSEFGRTVKENGNRGTDHGHGACYFLINGNLKSKNMISDWKDLSPGNLFEERDLPVTIDYRDVFAEIFKHQFGIRDFEKVFPNYKVTKKISIYS